MCCNSQMPGRGDTRCLEIGVLILRRPHQVAGVAVHVSFQVAALRWAPTTRHPWTAAEENPVHVKDIHATVLNQLGFDHEQLSFPIGGREFRLTQPAGKRLEGGQVVEGILA